MVNIQCVTRLPEEIGLEPAPDPVAPDEGSSDFVVIHGRTEDGDGMQVLRSRHGQLEVGAVRPLAEGKPIQGEVVRLHPRQRCPAICDVEVQVPAPAKTQSSGPPQVASETYRRNWDAIFNSADAKRLN
jgi:hypothetical protein